MLDLIYSLKFRYLISTIEEDPASWIYRIGLVDESQFDV